MALFALACIFCILRFAYRVRVRVRARMRECVNVCSVRRAYLVGVLHLLPPLRVEVVAHLFDEQRLLPAPLLQLQPSKLVAIVR